MTTDTTTNANRADGTVPARVRPCICIGWPTIARLAHGETVEFENAVLIPDDLLSNTAAKIAHGDFAPNNRLQRPDAAGGNNGQ